MRQKWTIFAMAALMVVSMTACSSGSNRTADESWPNTYAVQPNGETSNYSGNGGGDGTIGGNGAYRSNGGTDNGSGTNGSTASNNGTGMNNGNGILGDIGDGIGDVGDGIGNVLNDAGDAITGNDTSRYQDMVRNGRVHDTDGYLMDGENSHS